MIVIVKSLNSERRVCARGHGWGMSEGWTVLLLEGHPIHAREEMFESGHGEERDLTGGHAIWGAEQGRP